MTLEQNNLVEKNLHIVKIVMKAHIKINNNVPDMSSDDFYQVGCMALCKAAVRYDGEKDFFTFAYSVVKNGMMDYCRSIQKKETNCINLDIEAPEFAFSDNSYNHDLLYDEKLKDVMTLAKKKYTGITLRGIEAIEFKALGYTGKEIADFYGVKTNHVSAWISRAREKLKNDTEFMDALQI